jgi:hypothetical protein
MRGFNIMIEITGNDIRELGDTDLRSLVGLLCEAELRAIGLPTQVLHGVVIKTLKMEVLMSVLNLQLLYIKTALFQGQELAFK